MPFKGFVLIPEDRMAPFEKIATAARNLLARQEDAVQNQNLLSALEAAHKTLADGVRELEKVWDIPK